MMLRPKRESLKVEKSSSGIEDEKGFDLIWILQSVAICQPLQPLQRQQHRMLPTQSLSDLRHGECCLGSVCATTHFGATCLRTNTCIMTNTLTTKRNCMAIATWHVRMRELCAAADRNNISMIVVRTSMVGLVSCFGL